MINDRMSRSFSWEWPSERATVQRLLVKVDSYRPYRGGFFGLGRSQSLAGALPDPMDLRGTIEVGSSNWVGERISVRLPGAEVAMPDHAKIEKGDIVAIGLVADSVVGCAMRVPDTVPPDQRSAWLEVWVCGH